MEKPSMLMDWKNKYCKNIYATQSNLHIQCHPYQNNIDSFHRVGANNPEISMEPKKTLNHQGNVEKEKQNWGAPGWHNG